MRPRHTTGGDFAVSRWSKSLGGAVECPSHPYRTYRTYRTRRTLLLKASTDRRDALRVEPEPVHPSGVARVLDFEAAIHDHGHAA